MRWGHRDHQENRVVEQMRSASCMRTPLCTLARNRRPAPDGVEPSGAGGAIFFSGLLPSVGRICTRSMASYDRYADSLRSGRFMASHSAANWASVMQSPMKDMPRSRSRKAPVFFRWASSAVQAYPTVRCWLSTEIRTSYRPSLRRIMLPSFCPRFFVTIAWSLRKTYVTELGRLPAASWYATATD
jgi:hypothetical protein